MTRWVSLIIAANIAVFFLQQSVPGVTEALILVPKGVALHPWTPFTYMFLHGSVGHILFNMLALYFFGPRLETLLGGGRFITLYLLSGLGGALLSFVPMYYASQILGASGAVFGVVTAYARVWPRDRIYIYGVIPIQAWWFVMIMASVSLLGGIGYNILPGTAHFGHLGGIVVGWLYMAGLARTSGARRSQQRAAGPLVASDTDALRRWATIPVTELHELNRGEVQRLLEKARAGGARSLTLDERATLDRFSRA